jgi:hypothetical protein
VLSNGVPERATRLETAIDHNETLGAAAEPPPPTISAILGVEFAAVPQILGPFSEEQIEKVAKCHTAATTNHFADPILN